MHNTLFLSVGELLKREPFFWNSVLNLYLREVESEDGFLAWVSKEDLGIFLNVDGARFQELIQESPGKAMGVLKHELLHVELGHLELRFPKQHQGDKKMEDAWNYAADLAINSFLGEESLPHGVFPGKGMFSELEPFLSAEEYFEAIKNMELPGTESFLVRSHQDDWDGKNIPRKRPAGTESLPPELRKAIKSKNSEGFLELFGELERRASVFRRRKCSPKYKNKRFERLPGVRHFDDEDNKFVVYVDQSKSVPEDLVSKFFGFVRHLNQSAKIVLIPFDSVIHREHIEEFERGEFPASLDRVGWGGTDFDLVVYHANDHFPEKTVIVLTDLISYYPVAIPNFDLIWVTDDREKPSVVAEIFGVSRENVYEIKM
jgi:predicted metal-dependent peptidase